MQVKLIIRLLFSGFFFLFIYSCGQHQDHSKNEVISQQEIHESSNISNLNLDTSVVSLLVLGTVQDAGSPHIACKKDCCKDLFSNPDPTRKVVSLGIVDRELNQTYLFEASPDIVSQLKVLKNTLNENSKETPDAIFVTHAHIGHYSGLMYLGKEAMNANSVPVYTMPQMRKFLETNGPWSQLVFNKNIQLLNLENGVTKKVSKNIKVTPFKVPHRDEYSETVGFKIEGPNKKVLFIPDIDKWSKWEKEIVREITNVDIAFLDATFFDGEEINNRDISEIPHPFIIESMELFKDLSKHEKSKINFIHFNHTNPALNINSKKAKSVLENGFNIAKYKHSINL